MKLSRQNDIENHDKRKTEVENMLINKTMATHMNIVTALSTVWSKQFRI